MSKVGQNTTTVHWIDKWFDFSERKSAIRACIVFAICALIELIDLRGEFHPLLLALGCILEIAANIYMVVFFFYVGYDKGFEDGKSDKSIW